MSQTCCAVDLYLPQACKNGLIQHLEHLLFYGVDKDSRTASGNTPLHISALSNQVSYVSWSECCNIFGWWCLYQTCFRGIILPLKFLLDVGLFFWWRSLNSFQTLFFLFGSFDCCCLCLNEREPEIDLVIIQTVPLGCIHPELSFEWLRLLAPSDRNSRLKYFSLRFWEKG